MAGYLGHKPTLSNYTVDEFTTSSAQVSSGNFTLSQTVTDTTRLEVSVGGIDQPQSAYSVTGTTLAFGANIVTLGDIVIARHAGESISYPSLEAGAVTTAKIGTDAIDGTKIADDAINSEHYTDGSIDTAHIANDQITGAKLNPPLVAGDIIYASGTDIITRLAKGTAAQVLTMNTGATAPEWSAAAAGGDSRNFAIDGDFTQWPQGVGPTTGQGGYASAMMDYQEGTDGTMTWERSTDVPTKAESGHQSTYSMLLKCTGTDTSIGASQYATLARYCITGADFGSLHQQAVTISFWAKTSAANSGHTYYLQLDNRNVNRTYVKSFTPTSSWAKYSFPLTFDTVGTWTNIGLESEYSMRMLISGSAGTTWDNGTDGAWTAGFDRWASSPAISNFMDDTSNEWYMSQFQIKLGTSTPTFTSPPISTIRSQIAYYFQTSYPYSHGLYPGGAHMNGMVGDLSTSSAFNTGWYCIHSVSFYPMMRKSPTIVTYDRAGTAGKVTRYNGNSGGSNNGIVPAIDSNGATGFRAYLGIGGSPVSYPIYGFHMGYTADARH